MHNSKKKNCHYFEVAQIECPVIFIRIFFRKEVQVDISTKSNHDHILVLDQLPKTCILKCVKSQFLLCNNIDNKLQNVRLSNSRNLVYV